MIQGRTHQAGSRRCARWLPVGLACSAIVALTAGGCDAFNPAFINILPNALVTPQGPDSAGHVVVAFRNDTFFDEQLLQRLVEDGLDAGLLDEPDLRPRVRMRVRITFVNGQQLEVEFNDGSSTIVDPRVNTANFPDLSRTEQTNLVVQCDVARVELVGLPSVFVPVFFQLIRIDPGDENTPPFRVLVNTTPPQFEMLDIDDVDAQGNTQLQRNLDIRDVPGPAVGPNCGSVVTITLSGTLRTSFEVNALGLNVPGSLETDVNALAGNPGRFRLTIGIR